MATKRATWKQEERTGARDRQSGKFSKLNPCQCCGKSAGADYISDDRCNLCDGWGQVLCAKCGRLLSEMSDIQYVEAAKPFLSADSYSSLRLRFSGLQAGDRVEVHQILMASPEGPVWRWCDGYEFVRVDGSTVLVKQLKGVLAGCEVRYIPAQVRAEQPRPEATKREG